MRTDATSRINRKGRKGNHSKIKPKTLPLIHGKPGQVTLRQLICADFLILPPVMLKRLNIVLLFAELGLIFAELKVVFAELQGIFAELRFDFAELRT